MKSKLFLALIISSFLIVGCNKKKDAKKDDKAKASKVVKKDAKKDAKKNTKKDAKKDAKKDTKKVVKNDTKKVALTSVKSVSIKEIGTPVFAMCLNLKSIYNSPLAKELEIDKHIKMDFGKSKDFNIAAFEKCIGKKVENPLELTDKLGLVFNSDKEMAVVMQVSFDANKLLNCITSASGKKDKIKNITVNNIKGYKLLNDKNNASIFALDNKKILMISDAMLKKVKIGEGQLGKGDFMNIFAGANGCIKFAGTIPGKMLQGKGIPLPPVKAISLIGGMSFKNGFAFNLLADTGNEKAAQSIVSMYNVYKNAPQAKNQIKALGLKGNLIDAIKVKNTKGTILIDLKLDSATVKQIAAKIKPMMNKGVKKQPNKLPKKMK